VATWVDRYNCTTTNAKIAMESSLSTECQYPADG
jgi:hypothetical protein